MTIYQILIILLALTAIFSFINERLLHLQPAIGLMVLSLLTAGAISMLQYLNIDIAFADKVALLGAIDFHDVLMNGMLCFLLFAGALQIPLARLDQLKWTILTLAMIGTVLATGIIGGLIWFLLNAIGFQIDLIYALIFGAIISPTDPVAALAILSKSGLPKRLQTLINGESLFNDGVGVVLFTVLVGIALDGEPVNLGGAMRLFSEKVIGGVLLGLCAGGLAHLMLSNLREEGSRVLVSLAIVTSTYAMENLLSVSGPIAVVVVGLIVGNFSLRSEGDGASRHRLGYFWDYLDHILESILFVLLGMQLLVIDWSASGFAAIVLAVVVVLIGRWTSLLLSISLLSIHHTVNANQWHLMKLLTWAGLRGGLAVALVLSLPMGTDRDLLVMMTFGYVTFSLIVQGLTVSRLFSPEQLKKMALDQH